MKRARLITRITINVAFAHDERRFAAKAAINPLSHADAGDGWRSVADKQKDCCTMKVGAIVSPLG